MLLTVLIYADQRYWLLYDGGDAARLAHDPVRVVRVVDGDTLDVDVPDGPYPSTRIRLWGIDAPELVKPNRNRPEEPWAAVARDLLAAKVVGREVVLHIDPVRSRGRYGRVLAYIEGPSGVLINTWMLQQGLARADSRWGHDKAGAFERVERRARRERRGMWR